MIKFYKDPKTRLSINNKFEKLLKAGHKATFRQVDNVIKNLEGYHKAKTYKEQKYLFLKTVTGLMSTYQADTFFLKQHSKLKVKFVALINVELTDILDGQYPSVALNSILKISIIG